MSDEQPNDLQPVAPPAEPTPAPAVQEPPRYSPEINQRNAEFLARTPEAEMDLLNKLAQKPGSVVHQLIIKDAQAEAREKYGLSKDDTPLLAANTPEEVMQKAEALRKRYDSIAAQKPAAPEAPVPAPAQALPVYKPSPAQPTGDVKRDAIASIVGAFKDAEF